MLVDTDVMIWHLRGYAQATRRLDQLGTLTLSAVTYLEVLQGMRNRPNSLRCRRCCSDATILPLTDTITQQAIALMELLTLSHRLQMGDALIAATALVHQLPLFTGNVKHFAAVEHLLIEGFSI